MGTQAALTIWIFLWWSWAYVRLKSKIRPGINLESSPSDTGPPTMCKDTSASLCNAVPSISIFRWWITSPRSVICIDDLRRETAWTSVCPKHQNHIKCMHIFHTLLHAVSRKKSSIRIADLVYMDHFLDHECVCAIVYHKANVLMCWLGTILCGSCDENGDEPWAEKIGFGPLWWWLCLLPIMCPICFISLVFSAFSGNWWLIQFPTNVSHVQP